jgi:SAM-dependent methyltransferase
MTLLGEACFADYDALAPHYDAYTAHPEYASWVRSLEALARRHGLTGRRALDLGCGTGASLLPLLELGYDVVGTDVSPGMLEQAARKLPAGVRLVATDMCSLPDLGSFDLVWALNDAINCLVGDDELPRTFARVAACLQAGGIFLFDVNTLPMYATSFAATRVRETETLHMAWVGSGDECPPPGEIVEARLEIFELDPGTGLWRRSASRHRQRHHPLRDVRGALEAAGLDVLGIHGLTEDAAIDDEVDERRHRKAIFVVTREGRETR